ncbi:hypothetical protein EJ110_NYTH17568 [Nymphaea thermarum]|nr:hypothetical protein EJ110_NYTH17568 [Nymphaea thermarum]
MQPLVFTKNGSPDKAEEWIEEVECIFELLKMPEQGRMNYGSYLLKVHARNKNVQEFLELQQNHLSLKEYATKYRHLEMYCPHIYTTDEARVDKFVHGLHDGLRSRVMSSRPRNLDKVHQVRPTDLEQQDVELKAFWVFCGRTICIVAFQANSCLGPTFECVFPGSLDPGCQRVGV